MAEAPPAAAAMLSSTKTEHVDQSQGMTRLYNYVLIGDVLPLNSDLQYASLVVKQFELPGNNLDQYQLFRLNNLKNVLPASKFGRKKKSKRVSKKSKRVSKKSKSKRVAKKSKRVSKK